MVRIPGRHHGWSILVRVCSLCLLMSLGGPVAWAGTSNDIVTFQGQLVRGGVPVTDSCAFEVSAYPGASSMAELQVLGFADVAVTNGLFELPLTLEPTLYDISGLHVEVRVACSGDGGFSTLSPRTRITRTPYSLNTRGLSVDADGEVGIGTNDADAPLEIVDDAEVKLALRASQSFGADTGFVIQGARNGSTNVDVAYVDFEDFDDNEGSGGTIFPMARIAGGMDATSGTLGVLRLKTFDGTELRERMHISSTGYVGIGWGDPDAQGKLTLYQSADSPSGGITVLNASGGRALRMWVDAGNRSHIDSALGGDGGLALNFDGNGPVDIGQTIDLRPGASGGGQVWLQRSTGFATVRLNASEAGSDGAELRMYDAAGTLAVDIDAEESGGGGVVALRNDANERTVELDADESNDGAIRVWNAGTATSVQLLPGGGDAEPGSGGQVVIGNVSGANLALDGNEIMARNNGATSTLFLNNDGGTVEFGGPIRVPETIRYASIPAVDFDRRSNMSFFTVQGAPTNLRNDLLVVPFSAEAGIQLPHGARIVSFGARVDDRAGGAGQNVTIRLARSPFNSFTTDAVAQVVTSGADDKFWESTDIGPTNEIVNNSVGAYFVEIDGPGGITDTIGVESVRVGYVVTSPLP